jgi:hypothetical protein
MAPIYMARALADGRHRELFWEADRRRLFAALPPEPGLLQRFALRVAGWGRRPVVVAGRPAVVPPAHEPSAI